MGAVGSRLSIDRFPWWRDITSWRCRRAKRRTSAIPRIRLCRPPRTHPWEATPDTLQHRPDNNPRCLGNSATSRERRGLLGRRLGFPGMGRRVPVVVRPWRSGSVARRAYFGVPSPPTLPGPEFSAKCRIRQPLRLAIPGDGRSKPLDSAFPGLSACSLESL
jgi:hypothetical protein